MGFSPFTLRCTMSGFSRNLFLRPVFDPAIIPYHDAKLLISFVNDSLSFDKLYLLCLCPIALPSVIYQQNKDFCTVWPLQASDSSCGFISL